MGLTGHRLRRCRRPQQASQPHEPAAPAAESRTPAAAPAADSSPASADAGTAGPSKTGLASLSVLGGVALLLAGGFIFKDQIKGFLDFFIDAVDEWGAW